MDFSRLFGKKVTLHNPGEPIRLMEVMAPFGEGGGPVFLRNLAGHLDPKTFSLSFVFTERGGLYEQMERRGLSVFFLSHSRLIQPSVIWKLARIFKAHSPHIVQSHGARMNVYTRLAARLAGVPVLISTLHNSLHDYPIPRWKKRLYIFVDRLTAPLSEQIVCVAENLAKEMERSGYNARPVVIQNGIDLAKFNNREGGTLRRSLDLAGRLLIGFVGRLTPQKDPLTFLRAFKKIHVSRPDTVALVVGDGPLREALEREATKLGLGETCRFLGYREDIPEILAALDLFILSSVSEGLPFALLEAMAAGKPVVATAVNGVTAVVRPDQGEGILVPPGDPALLAEAALECLKDPTQAQKMGSRGRHRVEEAFTVEHMVKAWGDLYQRLLGVARPEDGR